MNTTNILGTLTLTLLTILKATTAALDWCIDVLDDTAHALTKARDTYARTHLGFGTPPPLSPTPKEARQLRRNDDKDAILWVSVGLLKVTLFCVGLVMSIFADILRIPVKALEPKAP